MAIVAPGVIPTHGWAARNLNPPRKECPVLDRKQIPNLITGSRLLAIPVLWLFAFLDRPLVVGAGLFFAWLSDALDGFLARLLDARTAWGSQFDSISDTLMFVSAIVWVAMLRPEFIVEHALLLAVWLGIGVAAYVVAWIRFRRLPDVHLLSAKAGNFLGFLFGAYLLAFGTYPDWVAGVVLGWCILAACETLLVVAIFDEVDDRILTVFHGPARSRGPAREPDP
ncbi:MAG: CDP-alcohol phosphatidyltransferase family protein [Gemmatimonadales bacterium]|nr:MAG: CDP-alcohol phosphatidyltransferase family protein [Gemmatimonadales bacterium]